MRYATTIKHRDDGYEGNRMQDWRSGIDDDERMQCTVNTGGLRTLEWETFETLHAYGLEVDQQSSYGRTTHREDEITRRRSGVPKIEWRSNVCSIDESTTNDNATDRSDAKTYMGEWWWPSRRTDASKTIDDVMTEENVIQNGGWRSST